MSQLKLTIVGDPTPLRNATRQAEKSLRGMSKVATSVGNSLNKSLGAVGLGIGLAALTNGLKNATKAASEDRKSQGLLAVALKNTVGATSEAIAGAEKYIKQTQLSSAVLDDDLRPALSTAVRATGSLAKGQELLDVALDVSAGTGKDLGTVTNAMAKAFNGNTGALKKLLPSIKEGSDFMGQLKTQFKGSAEEAAKLDPYKRLEVIFADIQETVGEALLPALEQFSAYLASPTGQENVRQIVGLFVAMGQAIGGVIQFLIQNITVVKLVVAEIILLKISWLVVNGIVKLYEIGVLKAVTATKALKWALVSTGLGAVAVAVGTLAAAWLETAENAEDAKNATEEYGEAVSQIPKSPTGYDEYGYNSYEEFNARRLGYADYAAQVAAEALAKDKRDKAVAAAKALADKVRQALDSKIEQMKSTAEEFRDAVALSFGLFGEDEYAVFNVDYFKAKLQRMVSAAKGFASNLKAILKTPGSQPLVNELIGMGPVEGNIAAKALLASGDLSEIVGLKSSLYTSGAQAGAVQATMGNATYEININKAVISATDIIKEIRILEKKSGRKYLVG